MQIGTKLTQERQNRIKQAARNHLDGKSSYFQSLETAKREGKFFTLFGENEIFKNGLRPTIRNIFKQTSSSELINKHAQIKTEFNKELDLLRNENAQANIEKLKDTETNLTDIDYQIIFANLNYKTSQTQVKFEIKNILELVNLIPQINSENINEFVEVNYTCQCNKEVENGLNIKLSSLRSFLENYCICMHKNYGIAIPEKLKSSELVKKYLNNQYKAICFSGGGAKGVAFAGALEGLGEAALREIQSVSGASAGAMTAALVSCGIKPHEFTEFIATTNLKNMTQDEMANAIKGKMFEIVRKRIEENSSEKIVHHELLFRINDKNNIHDLTFSDLDILKNLYPKAGFKNLFITVTDVEMERQSNFQDAETTLSFKTSPDIKISQAVKASAALPILFEPVMLTINSTSKLYRDGGLTQNLPVGALKDVDRNGKIIINQEENLINEEDVLVLGFNEYEGLSSKPLSISEKLKHKLAGNGAKPYLTRRADIAYLEKRKSIFAMDTGKITTTSFVKSAKNFFTLTTKVRDDFIRREKNRNANTNTRPTLKSINTRLLYIKYKIYPQLENNYYHYGKKLLGSNDFSDELLNAAYSIQDEIAFNKRCDDIVKESKSKVDGYNRKIQESLAYSAFLRV